MPFEVIRGPGVPQSHLPFSPAIKAGNLLFVSGQASTDESGKVISDTFENEFRRTLENLQKILAAAGLGLADVVQVRSYLKNQSDWDAYNRLYREYFKEPLPARTTLVNCLGTVLYEVDVIAYDTNV
jgi:2-iminobutanoate/2-iminopropanoate deaminase